MNRLWEACAGVSLDACADTGACADIGARVMAIVNLTPDSFYAGSRLGMDAEAIVQRVTEAVEQGAAILDVGGYSSRPGAAVVSVQEELSRLRCAMEIIRSRFGWMPVSIDTFRSQVADTIIAEFGDCIINDISAGELDTDMVKVVARRGVPYIAMHMRGTPATMSTQVDYGNVAEDIERYFADKLSWLKAAGVDMVVIDPGFGFAKTTRQNFQLLEFLPRLAALCAPVMVGISRKSMIYKVTGSTPEESLPGTAALHWQALAGGAKILRSHDVQAAADVIKLYEYYKANDTNN